ncbi:MAG: glycosyltransferase family 39 protein, partial [Planctomycetota bacterium]
MLGDHSPPPMRRSVFYQSLMLIVALHSLLVWIHPLADSPRGYAADPQQVLLGYWELEEARSWVEGRPVGVSEEYRWPLLSIPAFIIYKLCGVGIASSRVLSFLASVASILLVAALLRRRLGRGMGLFGAFLLAFQPAWIAWVRSPLCYSWMALWLLGILALSAGRGWRQFLGWGLLILAALTLHPIFWLLAPVLILEEWWQVSHNAPHLKGVFIIALGLGISFLVWGAGSWGLPEYWERVKEELIIPSARWLDYEARSRFFSAVPLLLPMAWIGMLLFLSHVFPTKGGSRALERVLHATIWGSVALFSFFESGPRLLPMLLPLLAYQGAVTA